MKMRIIGAFLLVSVASLCYGQQPCSVAELAAGIAEVECSQTYLEPYFEVFNECREDNYALELVDNCRTHDNQTCSEMLNAIVFGGPTAIRSCYRDDTFQERVLPCSSECKDDLETFVSETLGCCSHSIFQDFLVETAYPSIVLIKGLLEACNVTEEPPCATPSTLSFTPTGAQPICSPAEVAARVGVISCESAVLDPIIELFTECMYPSEVLTLACEQDDTGVYCQAHASDSTSLALFDAVDTNCIEGEETCSDTCRSAVITLREDVGCCANNLYNNSLFTTYSTSYELWSMCDVETLQYCSESGGQVPAAGVNLFLAIVVLALALVF